MNEQFKNIVEEVKNMGFKVYGISYKFKDLSNYGWIVDNENKKFIYFQVSNFEGLTFSKELIPSKEFGSGIRLSSKDKYDENGNLSKDFIEKCLNESLNHKKSFKSFEHFVKHYKKFSFVEDMVEL